MAIQKKSEGLGDTIAKFTEATGIDKVVNALANLAGVDDCGCGARAEALNKIVPYKNNEQINEQPNTDKPSQ